MNEEIKQDAIVDQGVESIKAGQEPNLNEANDDSVEALSAAATIRSYPEGIPYPESNKFTQQLTRHSSAVALGNKGNSAWKVPVISALAALLLISVGLGAGYKLSQPANPVTNGNSSASIFIPTIGQGSASNGGASVSNGSSSGAVGIAPSIGAPGNATSGVAQPGVSSSAGVASMYPYPYPYYNACNPNLTPQIQNHTVSATGLAQISVPSNGDLYIVSTSLQSTSENPQDIKDKATSVVKALENVGFAQKDIQVTYTYYSGSNQYGGTQDGSQSKINYSGNANITAKAIDINQANNGVKAAVGAGANYANASSGYGNSYATPTSEQLQKAITQASSEAKTLAQSTASANSLSLGSINSVAVEPPVNCGYGLNGPQVVVEVTVSYDLK